jgi:hypothetical protein
LLFSNFSNKSLLWFFELLFLESPNISLIWLFEIKIGSLASLSPPQRIQHIHAGAIKIVICEIKFGTL